MRLFRGLLAATKKTNVTESDVKRFPLILYKQILRLHYGLPAPVREMGDQYVRDEFRRHIKAEPAQAMVFLHEWTHYYSDLSKQLHGKGLRGNLGKDMQNEQFDHFSEEQLHQLLELKEEAEKTRNSKIVF
ncbi:unnamed protein product, partial [Mesorhabditis belari]|uniref:Succinate dehydrogenase assembly factor 3 n=1 Tax=Mesorhabditis belari TaxID=2138241 RepID=A0AAF3FD28_9BILA